MTLEPMLYSVKEVAQILKVDIHLVYNLIKAGILPALKLGNLKVRKETLENFLADFEGMDLSDLSNIKKLDYINL